MAIDLKVIFYEEVELFIHPTQSISYDWSKMLVELKLENDEILRNFPSLVCIHSKKRYSDVTQSILKLSVVEEAREISSYEQANFDRHVFLQIKRIIWLTDLLLCLSTDSDDLTVANLPQLAKDCLLIAYDQLSVRSDLIKLFERHEAYKVHDKYSGWFYNRTGLKIQREDFYKFLTNKYQPYPIFSVDIISSFKRSFKVSR